MNWLRFENPNLLYLLWGVPLLSLLYVYAARQKRKAYQQFTRHYLFERLTEFVHFRRQKVRAVLVLLGYLFLVVALARPQIGTRLETIYREELDIMIALDISTSMLAEDIKPNRLLKAKHAISSLINRLGGARVGLIVFAGSGFVYCPLTTDYAMANTLLAALAPDTVSHGGTRISSAIDTARRNFGEGSEGYKVLIIFTDGEDHSAGTIDTAKSALKEGIHISCVGIGVPNQGVPIPLREPNGNAERYKRDRDGRLILTRLDDFLLQEIVQLTSGKYYQATPGGTEIELLYEDLSSLEKRTIEERQFTQYAEQFQYFVALAFLCLVAEILLADRKVVKSNSKETQNASERFLSRRIN